jgi:hypothetical protein
MQQGFAGVAADVRISGEVRDLLVTARGPDMMQRPRVHPVSAVLSHAVLPAVCALVLASGTASGSYEFTYKTCRIWPAVPTQRAIIVCRDGVENLILEAACEGQGAYGWIVPVPAEPTRIEEVSPGLLKTISLHTQPELTGDVRFVGWKWLAGLVTAWGLLVLFAPPKTRARALGWLVVVLLIGSIPALMLTLPYMHRHARPSWPLIPQHATDATGLRVVAMRPSDLPAPATVRPGSVEDFDRWLAEHGSGRIPESARPAVSACIQRGWHFVVATVHGSDQGLCSPPALSITFPAAEPVYPPVLGAHAPARAALELIVVAERRAAASDLATEFVDRFRRVEEMRSVNQPQPVCFSAESYGYSAQIRHPQAEQVMWSGCWLTRVYGQIDARHLSLGMPVTFGSPHSYRQHAYTSEGALLTGQAWAMRLWSVALPVGLLGFYGRVGYRRRPRYALLGAALPLAACLAVLAGAYVFLPRMPAELRRVFGGDPAWTYRWLLAEVQASRGPMGNMSLSKTREVLADYFRYKIAPNVVTMGSIYEEDSPGNYTLHEQADGFVLRWYSRWGEGQDFMLPRDPLEYYLRHPAEAARSEAAMQLLGRSRDPRAVPVLIGAIVSGTNDPASEHLVRITGFDLRNAGFEKTPALWKRWWAEHKEQSRREWLQIALEQPDMPIAYPHLGMPDYTQRARLIAACELARLGDAGGVPMLLKFLATAGPGRQLPVPDPRRAEPRYEAAAALAHLGKDEGYAELKAGLETLDVSSAAEALRQLGTERALQILRQAGGKYPNRGSMREMAIDRALAETDLESALRVLGWARAWAFNGGLPDLPQHIQGDVERLARMTRTPVPARPDDPGQIGKFFDTMQRRLPRRFQAAPATRVSCRRAASRSCRRESPGSCSATDRG